MREKKKMQSNKGKGINIEWAPDYKMLDQVVTRIYQVQ